MLINVGESYLQISIFDGPMTSDLDVLEQNLDLILPKDWEEMSINEQGIWINENADFIKDDFDEPHYNELTTEETVSIEWS